MSEAPTNATTNTATIRLPSPQISLPLIAILGYAAFLISGFGAGLGAAQPLPIYIFLGLMLLALQAVISVNRSVPRIVYIFLTSGFALVYAAFVYFDKADNFARSPFTYIVINILLVVVFFYDAIDRRRPESQGLQSGTGHMPSPRQSSTIAPFSFGAFAIDFGGLAILLYIASGILTLLTSNPIGVLNRAIHPINLGFTIGTISTLPALDLVVAIAATAVSLLLLGIIGVLAVAGQGASESSTTAVTSFGGALRHIFQIATSQVLLSLRLVLGPLVWLVPSFSIALFADNFTVYLNQSAAKSNSSIWDLFNPFSANSQANYGNGFLNLGLAIISVAAVILAVSLVEHEGIIIERTIQILGVAGRTVALTLFLFTLSLAFTNLALVILHPSTTKPFQIGSATLISLVATIIFVIYTAITTRRTKLVPVSVG